MGLLDSIWDTKQSYTITTRNNYSISTTRLAGTEPHAEFHSNDVTSVPWLCSDIHSTIHNLTAILKKGPTSLTNKTTLRLS